MRKQPFFVEKRADSATLKKIAITTFYETKILPINSREWETYVIPCVKKAASKFILKKIPLV